MFKNLTTEPYREIFSFVFVDVCQILYLKLLFTGICQRLLYVQISVDNKFHSVFVFLSAVLETGQILCTIFLVVIFFTTEFMFFSTQKQRIHYIADNYISSRKFRAISTS